MPKLINLTGQRFGRLTVIKRVGNDKQNKPQWLCQCNCKDKNEIIIHGSSLKSGNTKSCGCLVTKHGHYGDKIYNSWQGMIQRCTNPNCKRWKDYGGRGITVCERWCGKNGFIHFLKDMGKKYKPGFTLERINNELGYYKNNCEWATNEKQNKNKRNNRYVTYERKKWLFVELCEEYNMLRKIVYDRYYKLGWILKDALITPAGRKRKNG